MDLIFLMVLGIVVAYVFILYRVEKMADTPNVSDQIKQAVKDIYLADVEAIRNLSEVATKLQAAGLTIPGHTNVKGKMVVGTTSNAAELPAWLAMSVDDAGDSHIRLKTKNDDAKNTYMINRDGKLVLNAGGDVFSVDKNTTVVNNNLSVNGAINTPVNHTFRCAGRQHMAGEELLYILHKNGAVIGKEWGGNGNLSVQGDLSVGSKLCIGGKCIDASHLSMLVDGFTIRTGKNGSNNGHYQGGLIHTHGDGRMAYAGPEYKTTYKMELPTAY